MKPAALPLKRMSVGEKLDVIERVWESLRQEQEAVPSPAWHETVLRERQQLYRAGKLKAVPWTEAKKRLMKRVHDRHAA